MELSLTSLENLCVKGIHSTLDWFSIQEYAAGYEGLAHLEW
jgi:hypothetical protein